MHDDSLEIIEINLHIAKVHGQSNNDLRAVDGLERVREEG